MYYLRVKDSGKYFVGGYTNAPVNIPISLRYGNIKIPVLTDKPTAFFNRDIAIRHYKAYLIEQFKSKYTSVERLGYGISKGETYLIDTSDRFPDIEFLINDEVVPVEAPPIDRRTIFSFWLKVSGIDSDDISSIMMSMQAAEIRGKPCNLFATIAVHGVGDKPVFKHFCEDNRFRFPPAGAIPRLTVTGWGVCANDDLVMMKLGLEKGEEVYYLDVNYDQFDFPLTKPDEILKYEAVRLKYKSKKL